MAQQSQGGSHLGVCRFNAWPTAAELQTVAARHRITARASGLPSPDDPFGRLDRAVVERNPDGTPRRVRLTGWAIDADTAAPLTLAVLVDGRPVTVARADRPRPDVAEVYPGYGANHGYDVALDVPRNAGTVCVQALGVGSGLSATTVGCQIVK